MTPIWCMSMEEPIVSLSEYWHDEGPWRRLWSSYIVLPKPWKWSVVR